MIESASMAQEKLSKKSSISRFSPVEQQALTQKGAIILESTGESIDDLQKRGKKFWTPLEENYPALAALPSLRSEIAIFPDILYLPKSNKKSLAQQEGMVAQFQENLRESQGLENIRAILGNTPTHAAIAFAYDESSGKQLHGRDHNYPYARTINPKSSGLRIADVGFFNPEYGLGISGSHPESGHVVVFASPLVLPSRKQT
jgi:hypothetical protein